MISLPPRSTARPRTLALPLALLATLLAGLLGPRPILAQPAPDGAGDTEASETTPAEAESDSEDVDPTADEEESAEPDAADGESDDPLIDLEFEVPEATREVVELRRELRQAEQENRTLRDRVNTLQGELAEIRNERPAPTATWWRITLDARLGVLLGNVDDADAGAGAQFTLERPEDWRLGLRVRYDYRGADEETQAQKLYSRFFASLLPYAPLEPFLRLDLAFDEQRRITFHYASDIGFRFTILRQPYDPWSFVLDPAAIYQLGVAFRFEHEQFQPNADTDHRTYLRVVVDFRLEQEMADRWYLAAEGYFSPAVNDFGIYLLYGEVSLRHAVTPTFDLRLSWSYFEDTEPAGGGTRAVDQQFLLGFRATFQ